MNNNIDEKLSALYDGELDANEIDEVLSMLDKDTSLQKKLSTYALMSTSINNLNNVQSSALKAINQAWSIFASHSPDSEHVNQSIVCKPSSTLFPSQFKAN